LDGPAPPGATSLKTRNKTGTTGLHGFRGEDRQSPELSSKRACAFVKKGKKTDSSGAFPEGPRRRKTQKVVFWFGVWLTRVDSLKRSKRKKSGDITDQAGRWKRVGGVD